MNIIDWVVIITVRICNTLMPLHTPEASHECRHTFLYRLNRTSVPSIGAHVHYLHRRWSTSSEAYCCWVGTLSPHVAYITILGVLGWAPTEYEWPGSWTPFHLGCNPQVFRCGCGKEEDKPYTHI